MFKRDQVQKFNLLYILVLFLSLVAILSACGGIGVSGISSEPIEAGDTPGIGSTPPVIPTTTAVYVGVSPRSWSTYAYFNWEHDGYPYQGEHCRVYSDSAPMRTKERFALETESALGRILSEFEEAAQTAGVDLLYPKMEIFISSRYFGEVLWTGYAHYGGYLIMYDADYYNNYILQFPDFFPYRYVVAHEITHVFTTRLIGYRENDIYRIPHAWFDEGLATYFGIHPDPIRTVQQYEIAVARVSDRLAQGNPVSIRYSHPLDYPENLYELSVYYLIEIYGLESVMGIMLEMRSGVSFEVAFESRTGMTVNHYQENFDSLVRDFLAGE